MEHLEKLLTKKTEYATCDEEPKFYTALNSKKRLNLDKIIKDYSEIEYLVNETLTKMGVKCQKGIKNIANFNILDADSFKKLRKKNQMDTEWAFMLIGILPKIKYGKWFNIFVKENPASIVFLSTIHEIGHIAYHYLDNKIRNNEIEEAFAISFHYYGLETFNTLNYGVKYDISLKEDIKDNDDNELGVKTLKGLIDQFPTMEKLCFFLKDSTKKEILEKAGPKQT